MTGGIVKDRKCKPLMTTIVLPLGTTTGLGTTLEAVFQPAVDASFVELLAAIDVADNALHSLS